MNRKTICVLLLLAAMLLTAFAGCGKSTEPDPGTSAPTDTAGPGQTTDAAPEVTTAAEFVYEGPLKKYDNEEFRIVTWTGTDEWVLEADVNTTILDSKTFYHLTAVEAETGVLFEIAQELSGGYGAHESFIAKMALLEGSDDIDLICQYSLAAIYGALQGIYVDLSELPAIRWDAPYWSNDFVTTNTFNGHIYYCTGEMTRTTIYKMFLMTFNYDLAARFAIGDVHAMVEDGEWTIARLHELSQNVYEDLNANEKVDAGDLYGLVCSEYNSLDAFQAACNLVGIVHNDFGELEVNPDFYGEYGSDVVDRLRRLFHQNDGAYCHTKINPVYDAMMEGKALFQAVYSEQLINNLQPSGINYGILPMPKYNEEQTNYHTCLGMTYSIFSVPRHANDKEMSAVVIDALAHDGYESLTPYIFQTSLKSRYAKTDIDAEMFDYLRDGVIYNPERLLDTVDMFALVRRSVRDNESLTTYYAEKVDQIEAELSNVNFAFS